MKTLFGRRQFAAGTTLFLAAAMSTVGKLSAMSLNNGISDELPKEAEMMAAKVMQALPYERTTISGANALAEWEQLRQLGRGYPVMIGSDDKLLGIAEQFSIDDLDVFPTLASMPDMPPFRSPAEILKAAASISFPGDLSKWPGAFDSADLQVEVGDWPSIPPGILDEPILPITMDLVAGALLERVHVLFIPTEHSWEVPAYLRWGDWNACPPPEYHVAALQAWHQAFGLELVGISNDSMDLRVSKPPQDQAEALAIAKQIYAYCPDIVDQGTGTLAALAGTMVMGNWWNFWWD